MTYTRTPTLASPVTLMDAKHHLRVMHDDEDLLIQRYILAAAREIEAYCEIALTRQTISLTVLAEGGDIIPLPVGPLAPDAEVTANGTPLVNSIMPGRWPVLILPETMTGPIALTYEAGFADTSASVPDDLQLAIMEQAAFAYDNRGSVDVRPGLVPAAARICARYRRVRA
ncbi:head-tail connector protein [Paracoccus spongiarum]|uniref:Head-tail connector protein n=1 Tax=Paracoccus spongiarum TaxID=3064387 RepID=A0ABT9JGN0_9RHOB|nr:head-tail connector protein [Paracoccus sp. 2205BS29-5]MDP5308870.1 head-tail connector protein [Paracoccus sp. 2205BS29-5]